VVSVQNKVVVRYLDGRVLKGNTADFLPTKPVFHVVPTPQSGSLISVVEVKVSELKALFFVKDFTGDSTYDEIKAFSASSPAQGRRIQIVFKDDETLVGMTMGYQPDRQGFFLIPADPKSNNDRCFVVAAAVKEVRFI
jgi:hypothetical protein